MNAPLRHASRSLEVESLARLDHLLEAGSTSLQSWHIQSLELSQRSAQLRSTDPTGAVFLGCTFAPGDEDWLRAHGALIFPVLPGLPFNQYRAQLYTGTELYAGVAKHPYESTVDAQIYRWWLAAGSTRSLDAKLAMAMHDHAIADALDDALRPGEGAGAARDGCSGSSLLAHTMVGVMGGHAARRGSSDYGNAAQLGRMLGAAGYLVGTGGGPGAMEAANLGAYLSAEPTEALNWALEALAHRPSFRPSVSAWARAAVAVVEKFPSGVANVGIPTWFYGHEPPNIFATHIAKYFANSVREAELLTRSTGGIIFLPGSAGTVREIFQDACENYYASEAAVAPMVLVGAKHWTSELPVWPLLQRLAQGKPMEQHIFCVDSLADAVSVVNQYRS
ncbi:MAG: Rossmann fold nucleotide-binding protein [Acidobacteria bacterium]|nr:Rossmann fold nucleotide-binding protein [Acidobacteriota bacterium]